MHPQQPRKQYLVNVGYQLRFVTRSLVVVFMVAISSALLVSALLWVNMRHPEEEFSFTLSASLIAVALTLLVELLLAIPLVFVLGIRQSHRIVGPLKRMTRTLESIGRGDFSQRLRLRKGDVLEDLAASINQMAEQLHQRFPPSSS